MLLVVTIQRKAVENGHVYIEFVTHKAMEKVCVPERKKIIFSNASAVMKDFQ